MGATRQTFIGEFEKNSSETVKAHLQTWKGNGYLDLRVWIAGDDKNGQRPTPKGLTLSVELIDELIRLLEMAQAALGADQPGAQS